MNEVTIIISTIIALFVVSLLLIRHWIKQSAKPNTSDEVVEWLKSSTTSMNTRLDESMAQFNHRLDNSAAVIAQVQKNIGEFAEIGRSMTFYILQNCVEILVNKFLAI